MSKQLTTQKGQHIADLTEDEARAYLEKLLWPNGPVCSHCSSTNVYRMVGESFRAGLLRCRDCEKQFSVTIGTIFEDSHVPLAKWIRAFHLMCSSKKGISALQLQRNLGLGSYRTAWHMAHRIRLAMTCEPFSTLLQGPVEADETYIGGKTRGQGNPTGKGKKTPVFSLVEREGEGRKYTVVMPTVNGKNVREVLNAKVQPGAKVDTDTSTVYGSVKHDGFQHETVNHEKKEYVRKSGDGIVTTNTVEGSFSLLKRGIIGAFHHVSVKHLPRYCGEFDFRWNARKEGDVERTKKALTQSKGKRLSYKPLTERSGE